jgi:Tol biopolymer transport system component/DNA-binding winged helix-turn-helix (wHTH) protein
MQAAEQSDQPPVLPEKYTFGLFEADLKTGELRKNGKRIRIQGQPFRVLSILLEHHGEIVSKEQIQKRLWGDNTTVDFDHSLGIAINKLRDALGDSADNPRFIETLARRGYRFIAPVKEIRPAETDPQGEAIPLIATSATPVGQKHSAPNRWTLAWAVLALCFALLTVWLWLRTPAAQDPLRISAVTHHGKVLATQLDVENFSAMAVEGGRIYFSQLEEGRPVLAEALTTNGEVQDLRLPSEIVAPLICSISRDGSRLIVRNHLAREPEQPLWIVPALGGQAERFGNVLAHDAAWMPDGEHILYATGNVLFVAREDGQESQQLVTLPGRAFWLRWSPDGKLLRFTVLDPETGDPSLWEYNASGHKLRRLLDGWSRPSAECCGSWTPDGKAYLFGSTHDGPADIWQMRGGNLDRNPEKLTNGPLEYRSPATGTGSNRVFFTGVDYRREMLMYSAAAHRFLPLENNLGSTALVEYSRDGQWVAWLNASDNTLWRSRADGTERLQLTTPSTPALSIFSMRWSPENRSLALMARKAGGLWAIYLIDANGGNLQPVLEENRGQADPNWSPDGRSIIFGRVPDIMGGESQPKAIFSVDLQDHAVEKIPGSDGLFSPRLSPDGRYIAALRSDQKTMMLFDRQTQRWTALVEDGAADPVWASNSRAIYYQNFLEPGEPVYRIDLPSGATHKIATLTDLQPAYASDYRLIALAPGDQPIVNTQSSSVNIYSLDLK